MSARLQCACTAQHPACQEFSPSPHQLSRCNKYATCTCFVNGMIHFSYKLATVLGSTLYVDGCWSSVLPMSCPNIAAFLRTRSTTCALNEEVEWLCKSALDIVQATSAACSDSAKKGRQCARKAELHRLLNERSITRINAAAELTLRKGQQQQAVTARNQLISVWADCIQHTLFSTS